MLSPTTKPVLIKIGAKEAKLEVVVCKNSPVSLLGRDAILALGLKLNCEGGGIDLTGMDYVRSENLHMANVYWVGDIETQVKDQVWSTWQKYVEAQIPQATEPEYDLHCTMRFDPYQDPDLEREWSKGKGERQNLVSTALLIGQEGAALNIGRTPWIEQWFQEEHAAPHIMLKVNPGYQAKDLGPMVKRAEELKFGPTENSLTWCTTDQKMIKIMVSAQMWGKPQMVRVPWEEGTKREKSGENLGIEEHLDQLPSQLWSQHDTDVGKVKSANPVEVYIKPDCKGPFKLQYPLKREAVEGVRKPIEGLLKSGVLRTTQSPYNTPLLPEQKADGEKWRLVHDLRAVNDVVQEMTAEVPNPHTLLTNVPHTAKWFTVIDLCSAFFSVPLAKQSQELFAFTFENRQYTYNRMPQGFKHSPHVFNQVLKDDLQGLDLKSVVLQYVDDLLICADTKEQCISDSMKLLEKLAKGVQEEAAALLSGGGVLGKSNHGWRHPIGVVQGD
ncbi:uncharacterized protein LOC118227043 isoform X2 [Anguilla anguilla]|uniref:uncharacterized protein LOC118227043 isoform X2 n=1 Tax=Anguilla anguilla TaxID=7936 RepID=UPI0015A7BD56|nr:uncharacterized protein LOC118227043 isoform X2 [Anguilla anguilla]